MCNRPAPIPSSVPIVATADYLFPKGASSHRIPSHDISAVSTANQRSLNTMISCHEESKLAQYSYPPPSGIIDPSILLSSAIENQRSVKFRLNRHRGSMIPSILLSAAIRNQRSAKCRMPHHRGSTIPPYSYPPPSGINDPSNAVSTAIEDQRPFSPLSAALGDQRPSILYTLIPVPLVNGMHPALSWRCRPVAISGSQSSIQEDIGLAVATITTKMTIQLMTF
jgi:hypothetical protein